MVHNTELCEEEIIDGFAIYAFLSYSDCEVSTSESLLNLYLNLQRIMTNLDTCPSQRSSNSFYLFSFKTGIC